MGRSAEEQLVGSEGYRKRMNDVTVTMGNMMYYLLLGFWLSLDRPSISVTTEYGAP